MPQDANVKIVDIEAWREKDKCEVNNAGAD
jgi:hypothetical protein